MVTEEEGAVIVVEPEVKRLSMVAVPRRDMICIILPEAVPVVPTVEQYAVVPTV
jgi:hypothetical protein